MAFLPELRKWSCQAQDNESSSAFLMGFPSRFDSKYMDTKNLSGAENKSAIWLSQCIHLIYWDRPKMPQYRAL